MIMAIILQHVAVAIHRMFIYVMVLIKLPLSAAHREVGTDHGN